MVEMKKLFEEKELEKSRAGKTVGYRTKKMFITFIRNSFARIQASY
jgi:hypothetical protein